ncbi:G2/M phase-specific E3 ubiquitin-protein ligase isoform X2 [Latimeria chalumnae]|nr:PREDICTED: G2/M phase-specific E3 ubiquitin-protein ligase-like [Latimeria chalumnae]|eukprot:XP_014342520.1 PREDICTED: G2/M phase-specific E3 ubiquitin-protein ligase-like [Latimeria chalumnae]
MKEPTSKKTDEADLQELGCKLCGRAENNVEKYGEKLVDTNRNLIVHYNCLILSSGLWQEGREEEGFHGFLPDTILKEVGRASKLSCSICKKKGASIGCCIKSCRKSFHYPCGLEKQCIFQFFDNYGSYCWKHKPVQSVLPDLKPTVCSVCLDTLQPEACFDVIKSPCCRHTWFHRQCLQRHALSAGLFFFMCAICSNMDIFQEEMLRMGIHIPERDASWELEEDAFSELLQRHQRCDVQNCLSKKGRKHCESKSKWDIVRCCCCGSMGTHLICSALGSKRQRWTCPECISTLKANRNDTSSSRNSKMVSVNQIQRRSCRSLPGRSNHRNGTRHRQSVSTFMKVRTLETPLAEETSSFDTKGRRGTYCKKQQCGPSPASSKRFLDTQSLTNEDNKVQLSVKRKKRCLR